MTKNKITLIVAAVLILALAVAGYVFTRQYRADLQRARQLAPITSLDTGATLRLYKAVGDWDTLTKNIAVYQEILSLVEGTEAEEQFLGLIPGYEAADLFVAFDYFISNGLPVDRIGEVLDRRARGEDWDNILAQCGITPELKNYRALEKDQIRQLLASGYLPEDIMKADEIARAKDLTPQEVLRLKTAGNTWDDVNKLLDRERETRRNMKLNVPGEAGPVDNPSALASISGQRAGERERDALVTVAEDLGLTGGQLEAYLSQGFNPWEVKNAYRLAQANGVSPQEVLDKKKAGSSWEEILAAYPEK